MVCQIELCPERSRRAYTQQIFNSILIFLSKNLACTEYFDYAQYELCRSMGVSPEQSGAGLSALPLSVSRLRSK